MGTIARGTGMKKILAAALMLGAVEFPSAALAQQATINQTITGTRLDISATGDVTRVPDLATISAGVVSRAATATAAMQQTASRMARVREALRKAGIADRDIQTSNISLNPDYRYVQDQAPKLTGYTASNQVNVRFRDVERTGDILDALVAEGANQINGPSLTIDKPLALFVESIDARPPSIRLRRLTAVNSGASPYKSH